MTELKEIYVDGINHINFVNGMIRLTMGTLVATDEDGETQPEFNPTYRVIMPLNSFLTGVNSQNQIIEKLIENGIISKRTEEEMNTSVQSEIIP